ncbi:uncharacterized protein KY384_006396, partial [Bacidia gigantensis]|uniref:uncharacterized protein n=1 Tax=Bacidia gigantensis TaxID=2732470 RepID=UPI001D0522C2
MADSEKYEVLQTIGHGSFGVIRKVRRRSDGLVLCRKEISYIKMSQKEREQLHAEFSILNSLKHANIVGYYHREHLKATQELYLYMEYCGGGDLGKEIQKLKTKNQYADEEYVWSVFSQIVAALYRCHYGTDPPEVGKAVGPGEEVRTKLKTKDTVMILHRDLKPENVFLGADSSVKLGDFGLSKLMQSHDFASTYVGTPFYMSPEICAAEKYTLHSDIWSLGCIMYELCARTQPFNAKTHFHLIQKIKEGKVDPLPSVYSQELQSVIRSCLQTNPLKRPDTATLLNLPAMRIMRKEREMVELGRVLKDKEEHATLKAREADAKVINMDSEREKLRAEIEATLRREWEVKAGLEISRQVQLEKERLNRIFESELQLRTKTEVERQLRSRSSSKTSQTSQNSEPSNSSASSRSSLTSETLCVSSNKDSGTSPECETHLSSISTAADTDFPSFTDLSSLSLDSPAAGPISKPDEIKSRTPPQKRPRGPLARARTQFDSPMDIQMVDPSPMSIACLSLSPRRNEAAQTTNIPIRGNIFATAASKRLAPKFRSPRASFIAEEDEDEDNIPDLPSPTRPPLKMPDPFKAPTRPGMLRQKTAPMNRLNPQAPRLFTPTAVERPSREFTERRGRTLVELAQARAGMPSQAQKIEKIALFGDGGSRKENVPIWDPEKDEMPSPFLVRGGK